MNSDVIYFKAFEKQSINYKGYLEVIFMGKDICLFFDGIEFSYKEKIDYTDFIEITELRSSLGFKILEIEQDGFDDFRLLLDSGKEIRIISTINFDNSITQKLIW